MSNLQTHYHFKLDFQKVDQHTGGTWLIHGTKQHKDTQLQSQELPCRARITKYRKSKHVVQNKKNRHKNPNNVHNYHDDIELYQGISKKNT